MATDYTDLNIISSVARYLAEHLNSAGWAVYWQETNVSSGVATNGEVTLLPEFPNEPNVLARPQNVTGHPQNKVVIPAFAIHVIPPQEASRTGLGEDEFYNKAVVVVDGFVIDRAQHLAFATLFREWFRTDTTVNMFDYETTPSAPSLISSLSYFTNRNINRIVLTEPDEPPEARYYLNLEVDLIFVD
jgi:hypothetical protein